MPDRIQIGDSPAPTSARRRLIDPTTCDRAYTDEEALFMKAMDAYKRTFHRPFPTWSEVLSVMKALGYRRIAAAYELATDEPFIATLLAEFGEARAEEESPVMRIERILSGEIREGDYLPVTPEVENALSEQMNYLRDEMHLDPTSHAQSEIRNDLTLQFHLGGRAVLCRRTPEGVLVLAAGEDAIREVLDATPAAKRMEYAVEYPASW